MNKVLVFAERMLPSTQTFIPLQVNELRRYQAQYVGLIPADRNYKLPHDPIMLARKRSRLGRSRRELYRWLGVAPRFHAAMQRVGSQLIHAHFAEGASPALFMSNRLNLPLILHLRGGAELMPDSELRGHLFRIAIPCLPQAFVAARFCIPLCLRLHSPKGYSRRLS